MRLQQEGRNTHLFFDGLNDVDPYAESIYRGLRRKKPRCDFIEKLEVARREYDLGSDALVAVSLRPRQVRRVASELVLDAYLADITPLQGDLARKRLELAWMLDPELKPV